MKINRIELFHISILLPKPFYPTWILGYPQTMNRFTLMPNSAAREPSPLKVNVGPSISYGSHVQDDL